jgi:hypothetical protein
MIHSMIILPSSNVFYFVRQPHWNENGTILVSWLIGYMLYVFNLLICLLLFPLVLLLLKNWWIKVKKQIKLFNNILQEKKCRKESLDRYDWTVKRNLCWSCWLSDRRHHFSMVSILNKSWKIRFWKAPIVVDHAGEVLSKLCNFSLN